MLEELFTILPVPLPFSLGSLSLGIALAVLVRIRNDLTDVLLNLKNRDYSAFDLAVLLSILVYAVSSMLGFLLPFNLAPFLAIALGLYLVVDALTGRNEPRDLSLKDGILLSSLQGILAPRVSTLVFLLPVLLAKDVRWNTALTFSLIVSLVYLLGSFLRPVLSPSILLGFFLGLPILAVLYQLSRLPHRWVKVLYGLLLVLATTWALTISQ